ncbi:MAG: lactate racemase domain-containing protein [Candidatus Caldatribacteriaceae bacterium]
MILFEKSQKERTFPPEEFREYLSEALARYEAEGKKILAIIPDATRTLPMKDIFHLLIKHVLPRTKTLHFLIALGTHPPLTDAELKNHLGVTYQEARGLGTEVLNHRYNDLGTLIHIGTIPRQEVEEVSRGLLQQDIPVTINRHILDYDELLIVGPVFPHEVVGFSGGHKYFFPGISGAEIIDQFHWLAALITNPKIIGHKETPVREILRRAAQFMPRPSTKLAIVMTGKEPCGLFLGDPEDAWSKAADLSSQVNIVWKDHPFHTVLSVAPEMYNELWVGGKCMYKLEPVVKDGGKIIIYAPHIREISVTHGKYLREIGYHVRDFFLAHWDEYQHYPWGVLAHSTHVKGIGKYQDGKEYPRIEVILATGLPEDLCRRINLGYMDYHHIRIEDYQNQEDQGILVVPRAGEMLYRLADGTVPDIDKL